jgi:transcriptional regulator with XRE-family HTH domain
VVNSLENLYASFNETESRSSQSNRQQGNCNNFTMAKSPPHAEFARRLRIAVKRYELRTGADLRQKELAKVLGYGTANVSNWFTGKAMPKVEQLEAIARKLDVSAGWLTFGEEVAFTKPDDGEPRESPSQSEQDHHPQAKRGRKR